MAYKNKKEDLCLVSFIDTSFASQYDIYTWR